MKTLQFEINQTRFFKKQHKEQAMILFFMFIILGFGFPLLGADVFVCTTFDCENKTTADGLGANKVYGVFESGDTIYAATTKGLSISTDGGNSFVNRTKAVNGLGADPVLDVFVSNGVIYAGTDGGGLSISKDGGVSFNNTIMGAGIGADVIFGVHESNGVIYAGTFGSGLAISTDGGNTFVNKTSTHGLGSNFVKDVHVTNGIIYVATTSGVSISTNGGISFTNIRDGIGSPTVFDVFESSGILYVGTNGGLSFSTNGGISFTTKTTSDGLGSNSVYGVFQAKGVLYAATTDGLSISTDGGNTFINRKTTDGLGANKTFAVYESKGVLYVGTEGGITICEVEAMANLTSSDTDNTICTGDNVTFTATGGVNYEFFLNDVSVQNGAANTYSNNNLSNGAEVKVIVTNSSGCTATSSSIITTVLTSVVGLSDHVTVNNPITANEYAAMKTIESDGLIESGRNIIFRANDLVTLKSGFTVEAGATFQAIMRVCSAPTPILPKDQIEQTTAKQTNPNVEIVENINLTIQPNPSIGETNLVLRLSATEYVSILLFDQSNRFIKSILPHQSLAQGEHHFRFDAHDLQSGLFYVVLQSETQRIAEKFVLLK